MLPSAGPDPGSPRGEESVALLLYGEERANAALADELAQDGFEVRRAGYPAMVPGRYGSGTVELVIFARAARRGGLTAPGEMIVCGALRIDTAAREVTFAGAPVSLRRLEYELLVHLAREPHRVHTKHELLRDVWGFRSESAQTRTVDSHASRLRRRLAQAGAEGWITAVRGVGYQLAQGHSVEAAC